MYNVLVDIGVKRLKAISAYNMTLSKKCPYLELFWPAFFLHFPAFRLNTKYLSVFSPNARKYGKNANQNNFEYGHFLRSGNQY